MQSAPNEIQPELFDQFTDGGSKPKQRNQRSIIRKRLPPRFAFTLSYESVIIAVIILISLIIASFSLGIKRGALIPLRAQEGASTLKSRTNVKHKTTSTLKGTRKHTNAIKGTSKGEVKARTSLPVKAVVKTKAPTSSFSPPLLLVREEKKKKKTPTYTVQVATFKQKALAEKEMSRLKKLNYNSFSKVKGKFHLVFVGNYSSKEQAGQDLKELRNIYKDCFVKKIESR